MSDNGEDERSNPEEEEEGEDRFQLPEVWRYCAEDKVGKVVKLLNTKEEEEFLEEVQQRSPETGQSLLMWATLRQRFVLVEWLVKKGKRDAFAFKVKNELGVYDRWVEERKAKAERDKEAAEEAAERAARGEEPEEEEEKEPEPEMWQTVMEGLEADGIDEFAVRRIGELGVYEGGRDNVGNKQGLGQALFPNGDLYIGEYKNNKREGCGTYFWAETGNIYCGHWLNNHRSGLGRMIHTDSGRYYGEWLRDRKNGNGRYTYPNGDTYDGEWVDDIKEGFGTYTFAADGSKFVGTYRDGEFISGKWLLNGGTTYYGVFRKFRPQGRGVFVFNGRFKQEGEYVKGKWTPHKIENINASSIGLELSLKWGTKHRVTLSYTPEGAVDGGMEELVGVANLPSFVRWKKLMTNHPTILVTEIKIRSLDILPGPSKSIQGARLKITAFDKRQPVDARQRIAADTVVLREPESVLLIVLVHENTPNVVVVRRPRLATGEWNATELPRGVAMASGSFRGEAINKILGIFELPLATSYMINLPQLCFADPGHMLQTDPTQSTSTYNVWLYKQVVASDYFIRLPDRIAAHNKDGDMCKVDIVKATSLPELLVDDWSATALALFHFAAPLLPQQTISPQRPPTPPPPEPEPVPIYSEEELALQRATLEAELAKAKPQNTEQDAEEEEEG
eukprot:TRINITY_DN54663_c0_g1_i1.p1 TRINITY_DN54663_c0_g1~~TRINITY_DN54663_c0_g1_i1.p1  ORF type:complete len:677 (+),score=142.67 TRINITY_DN54663_c0_g1_i1:79-2109(+)